MRAVFGLTVAAAALIAVAWWIAGLPGDVSATLAGTTISAATPVVIVLLGLSFLAFYLLLRLVGWLVSAPRRMRRDRVRHDRIKGDRAVTRTLVALAASDSSVAQREAGRSRRLLGDTPLTLLLAAQASRQAGQDDDASAVFRQLASHKQAGFLGLRGLLRQATAREDWPAAAAIARQAEASYPGARWIKDERKALALRTGEWAEALRLSGPDSRAALALAAAGAESDPNAALRLAKQAWTADPALAPAAVAYASRLRAAKKNSAANDVLRRTWAMQPHPDVAAEYLSDLSDPATRMRAATGLAHQNAKHPESRILLAQTALDAGATVDARHQIEAVRDAGLNQRRVWVLLADIAERDGRGPDAQDALRHVASADPDPTWRCTACGTAHEAWHPVCNACSTPGKISWAVPDRGPAIRQVALLDHAGDGDSLT